MEMERKPKESDWKLFRKRVPEWRERYLTTKNKEIIDLLSDEAKTPTEQFWNAKKEMDEQAKILVNCLDGHSRSSMHWYLFLMHRHGLIEDTDLEAFSEGLRDQVLPASKGFGQ